MTDYVDAFDKHDEKKLADFWSPEAVYVNHITGEQVVGRDEIAKQFAEMFKAAPDVKMTAITESIQFVSPNVAVERGNSTITMPRSKPPKKSRIRRFMCGARTANGLLDRVTDEKKRGRPPRPTQVARVAGPATGSTRTSTSTLKPIATGPRTAAS